MGQPRIIKDHRACSEFARVLNICIFLSSPLAQALQKQKKTPLDFRGGIRKLPLAK